MKEVLNKTLRDLRLSGAAETLDVRLQEAAANSLNHEEFIELVLSDEVAVRQQRQYDRRLKAAGFRDQKRLEDFDFGFNTEIKRSLVFELAFRDQKRLEDFDFGFNTEIKRSLVFELASCKFIREAKDVLMVGPPGVGKSHLAQAIGQKAVRSGMLVLYRSIFDLVNDFIRDEAFSGAEKVLAKYLKPDLLIVDDMGMKQLPKRSGEYLFEVIMRRYENRSTLMTSNRPIEEWGKLLQDVPTSTAILDRFLHHAEIVTMKGKSYRLKGRKTAEQNDAP